MMVEWRLEQESKNTEKVQYIGNGKVETEMGVRFLHFYQVSHLSQ